MKWICPAMGRCWFCPSPKECGELYKRPLDENYAFIVRRMEIAARYLESDEDKLKRVIAERQSMEQPKPEPEEKPGFIKAISIWTYWKIANIIWAIIKAIRAMRKT
jgi:hypothetical protein